MNILDFFHCNNCFSQPGPPKNLRFFLTSCGHSFCNVCVSNTNVPQCKVCKSSCKVIPLSHDLPDNLKLYFGDIIKEMKNVLKILVVQNNHCKIYMEEYAMKLETSYAETQKELAKVKAELGEVKKRYQELLVENQVLKKSSQLSQARNKSPLGMTNFTDNISKGYNMGLGRGSAFFTPSPSSASGFSGSVTRMGQGTPETVRTISPLQKSSLLKPNCSTGLPQLRSVLRTSPTTVNRQPFVLSTQPVRNSYGQSRTDSTLRSWSSGSGSSSRSTTKTLRKSSGGSFLSNMNNSSIF